LADKSIRLFQNRIDFVDYSKLDYFKLDYFKLDYFRLDYFKLDYFKLDSTQMVRIPSQIV